MTEPEVTLPHYVDPLGETLHLLRLTGTLYCRSELTAPWGVDMPPIEGCMMLHVVTAGQGWLETEDGERFHLEPGTLTLVPHGMGHRLSSEPGARADPLFDLPVEKISDRYEIMHHGGGGELTQAICVVVRFDHVAARHLIALLPKVLQIDAWDDDTGGWLQSTLRFIAREARALRPGGETVITRLADILVIQAIRSWLASAAEAERGWLGALRDDQIGRALAAIHRTPEKPWSIETLAAEAGMSRSAFCARFTDKVGQSAMQYLTQWRMNLAHTRLQETTDSLAALAAGLGYTSEAAFCRAFKRVFGVSPGSVRRSAA